jgi:hypothetical protein
MIETVSTALARGLSMGQLVDGLEQTLEAAEIKDSDLIRSWYDHWGPLEIHRALKGDGAPIEEVQEELASMERFLMKVLLREDGRET